MLEKKKAILLDGLWQLKTEMWLFISLFCELYIHKILHIYNRCAAEGTCLSQNIKKKVYFLCGFCKSLQQRNIREGNMRH